MRPRRLRWGSTSGSTSVLISKQALKEALGQFLAVLPADPVGIGDSWERTREIKNSAVPLRENRSFQLKRRINGVALLEMRSETEIDREGTALRPLRSHMNYDPYSGVTRGEILIDVKPTG
ncbi:MAG: hypothetical protein HQ582_30270 [Planctomycetes bacterium]|nr:hypothetical protein [Planctomycetota bacterium]